MEFSEKLQNLRKQKNLTQEQLAEKLYVSRTAVSKWESGRGYPGIDSLMEIARFFSVTVDELIGPEEILTAAENEKKEYTGKTTLLVTGILDFLASVLLFVPVFGNGGGSVGSVSLFRLTGLSPWIRWAFLLLLLIQVLFGIAELFAGRKTIPADDDPIAAGSPRTDGSSPASGKSQVVGSLILSAAATAFFILARQPYAGIYSLALLIGKGLVLFACSSKKT